MSKFIRHDKCPKCGSEDNLAVYDDNEHCYSVECGYHKVYTQRDKERKISSKDRDVTPLSTATPMAIKERGISSSSVAKYKVAVNVNPENAIQHIYPYFDASGKHIGNKVRIKPEFVKNPEKGKGFYCEGDFKNAVLFGMQEFPAGRKSITIVEGELDALAAFELTGSLYPCVSVRGASSAKEDCARVLDYLSTFEKVVINFDNDEAGQKAALQVANLFEPGKAHILKLKKGKDACDYLSQGHSKQYQDEWWAAPPYKPDGIKIGRNMWDEIINHKDPKSVPYPWDGMNTGTYGIRRSELVVINAPRGVGKTSIMKAIEYNLLMNPELIEANEGVGFLHFEEINYDTMIGLMSIHNKKPYHLPDTERTEDELRKAYEEVICNDRVVIWDHFGSNDIYAVLAKVRHMAALGCRYIFIDHLSIIVSNHVGDERKQLDAISTELKTLCMEKDLAIICVVHQNRQGEIRGTAGVEQLANIVIKLEREWTDENEWRRNITKLIIDKNRFCGRTGPACYLFWNETTNCLEELTKDQTVEYETGGNGAGSELGNF